MTDTKPSEDISMIGNYLNQSNNEDEKKVVASVNKDLIEFDELKMYFGYPYYVTDKVVVYQPTVGDVIEFGEREYYSMIHTLTCIPSDMKSQLEDIGINYMKIQDFELFAMLSKGITKDYTKLILGDLDLSKFSTYIDKTNDELVLYDSENNIKIDKLVYYKMTNYIKKMHFIKSKVENAVNETTRKILIQLDREKIAKAKNEPYQSQLKDMISGMMRYPGFKYKKNELKECGIYEFMDTVQGAQIYVSTTALLSGMYSGMVDTSKINKKEFNWMRAINE